MNHKIKEIQIERDYFFQFLKASREKIPTSFPKPLFFWRGNYQVTKEITIFNIVKIISNYKTNVSVINAKGKSNTSCHDMPDCFYCR